MKNNKSGVSNVILLTLGCALLIYSGFRGYDFISTTMPAGSQLIALFFLFATEGGIVAWLLQTLYGSRGFVQRTIAISMTIVDMFASFGLFTADTLFRSGQSGISVVMTEEDIRNTLIAMSVVVLLNVAAIIATHLFDPESIKRSKEQDAEDAIHEATLRHIAENSQLLAERLAPQLGKRVLDRMEEDFVNGKKGFKNTVSAQSQSNRGNTNMARSYSASNRNASLPVEQEQRKYVVSDNDANYDKNMMK